VYGEAARTGEEPDWSPDGDRLVFSRFKRYVGEDGLWSAGGDGRDVRRVTPRALDAFPAWSPRGDLIAFDRDAGIEEEDRRELHVVRPDGTGLRRLTEGGWHITPAFSLDGEWIAWARGSSIWRMRVDGTEAQAVTTGGGRGDTDPSWPPDGRTIAFTRSTYDVGLQPWLVEVESGEARPLVSVPGSAPDWSPDGGWIVFSRDEDEGRFLSLVRPDGTGLRPLTEPAAR
jgi:TolB protein